MVKCLETQRKRIFPSLPPVKIDAKDEDVEMVTYNFSASEGDFDVLCNVMPVFPVEYNVVTEVSDMEEEYSNEDKTGHEQACYYVMSDGCVKEQNDIFERPDIGMMSHLKRIFIKAKVDNVGINKVLVDSGTVVNLMPHSLRERIRKYDINLRPHNMVLSNYEVIR